MPIPKLPRARSSSLANAVEALRDGRIHIEKINGPMLFQLKATPAEYRAGLDRAIADGWLVLHESALTSGSRMPARTCSRDDTTAVVTFNG